MAWRWDGRFRRLRSGSGIACDGASIDRKALHSIGVDRAFGDDGVPAELRCVIARQGFEFLGDFFLTAREYAEADLGSCLGRSDLSAVAQTVA